MYLSIEICWSRKKKLNKKKVLNDNKNSLQSEKGYKSCVKKKENIQNREPCCIIEIKEKLLVWIALVDPKEVDRTLGVVFVPTVFVLFFVYYIFISLNHFNFSEPQYNILFAS